MKILKCWKPFLCTALCSPQGLLLPVMSARLSYLPSVSCLVSRCAKIVELLTVHCCWECGLEFSCSDGFANVEPGEDEEEKGSPGQHDLDHHSTSSRDSRSHKSKHSLLHSAEETVMPFITSDEKQQLQQTLPKDVFPSFSPSVSPPFPHLSQTSTTILKFWTLVSSERYRVWDFMEYLESCISCGALQLVGHKVDKKKERAISFAMKQVTLDFSD